VSKTFSTAKERVEYGLETIPAERTVTISLRDLLFVHQTLAEYMQFFHQPLHFPDLEAVERFLGDRSSGEAFQVLDEAYYSKMRSMIPPDIEQAFSDGERFEHPLPPRYFAVDEERKPKVTI